MSHSSKDRRRPKEKKQEKPEVPKYRDRAKERREGQNPDYEPTELGSFHAVAPPGNVDLRISDAHRISIENSTSILEEMSSIDIWSMVWIMLCSTRLGVKLTKSLMLKKKRMETQDPLDNKLPIGPPFQPANPHPAPLLPPPLNDSRTSSKLSAKAAEAAAEAAAKLKRINTAQQWVDLGTSVTSL